MASAQLRYQILENALFGPQTKKLTIAKLMN